MKNGVVTVAKEEDNVCDPKVLRNFIAGMDGGMDP